MSQLSRTRGFTLVEMSIVLVIIGLLVGGLLGIRSFLKSAELTTEINQAKYYISAFNQFSDRYRFAPGDLPTASTTWSAAAAANTVDGVNHNGNGNGLVYAGNASTAEMFYVFQHLSLAGMIDGSYTGATTGSSGTTYFSVGTNVPRLAVQNTSLLIYRAPGSSGTNGNYSSDPYYFDGIYGDVVRLVGVDASTNALPTNAFLPPAAALQLDSKFDDGVPNTGWILTPNRTALSTCTTAGGAYDTSTKANVCYFILRIQ